MLNEERKSPNVAFNFSLQPVKNLLLHEKFSTGKYNKENKWGDNI